MVVTATIEAANHSYKFKNWKYARKRHIHCTGHILGTARVYSYWIHIIIAIIIIIVIISSWGKKTRKMTNTEEDGKKRPNVRDPHKHTQTPWKCKPTHVRHARYMHPLTKMGYSWMYCMERERKCERVRGVMFLDGTTGLFFYKCDCVSDKISSFCFFSSSLLFIIPFLSVLL